MAAGELPAQIRVARGVRPTVVLGQPLGVAGFGEPPYPFVIPPRTVVDQLASGNAGLAFMVEIEPWMREPAMVPLPMSAGPGLGILGVVGLGELYQFPMVRPDPAPVERFVTVGGGMMTADDDDPPNAWIPGRLSLPHVRISRRLPDVGERLASFVADGSATLTLDGSDGAIDHLAVQRVVRDRPVRLKMAVTSPDRRRGVERPPPLAQWATVFAGRALALETAVGGEFQLRVADGWNRLDRPLQQRTYAGTGGEEGGPELAGLPLPLCYGPVFGFTPTLEDRPLGISRVHDGEILSLLVRDGGVPLQPVREVASRDELAALATEGQSDEPDIVLGQYAYCRRTGHFRVAGAVGPLTCDVQGDGLRDGPVRFSGGALFDGGVGWDSIGSVTHRRRAGGILYRVLTTRLGFAAAEVDLAACLQFDQEYPFDQGIGIPSTERPSGREMLERVLVSAGAVALRNRLGQITLRALTGPAAAGSLEIHDGNLAGPLERLALPWGAPYPSVRLGYAPQQTVLTDDQVLPELEGDARDALLRPSRELSASSSAMAALLPDRAPLVIPTQLRDRAAAEAVAARYLGFYGGQWGAFMAPVRGIGFRADILSTALVRVSRYGLQGGVPMLVIGSDERPGDYQTDLYLIGGAG